MCVSITAVVWDDVVTRGKGHLRESVVALSWLQSGDAHLTGYGFHVCGGHISRMFIGDTRGYAAARANANVKHLHRSPIGHFERGWVCHLQ